MVTLQELDDAVQQGLGESTLADLVTAPAAGEGPGESPTRRVYPDDPLELAMPWLADGRTAVLPVLSRTDIRELKGTISLPDVLGAYAMANGFPGEPAGAAGAVPSATRMLVGVVAALMGVAVLGGMLSYYYRAERTGKAEKAYADGNELLQKDRLPEAIEQYRNALSISHKQAHRQALALALVKADRANEASIYLGELLREHPNDGAANLGMAEALAGEGRVDEATLHFRRAIVGAWPKETVDSRTRARLELVRFLTKSGKREQARAELLAFAADLPNDTALQKQVGRMLIEFGLLRESRDLFTRLLKRGPPDSSEFDGLGEALFAAANYAAADEAFRNALEVDPKDEVAARRAELCDRIEALDPNQRGIGSRERLRRSEELLKQVVARFTACRGPDEILPPEVNQMLAGARAASSRQRSPRPFSDAADANTALAQKIWSHRPPTCQAPPDDPAQLILSKQLAAAF
jgi:tetratricopeptide (TPR) repeat protein